MIYALLRWITGIALHWFYNDIRIVGAETIPVDGPLLIAANHQNALVDSLIVAWLVPRHISMTAKATLADNPLIAALFRLLHVVPLRRVSDEVKRQDGLPVDRSRNAQAFAEIFKLLERSGALLIFPEGKSHNEAGLEPLKTGLARVALQARDEHAITGLRILPLGLVFEDKAIPGTAVCARVGSIIEMDSWSGNDHTILTQEVAKRLQAVSEYAGSPRKELGRAEVSRNTLGESAIALAAWWGRLTHRLPVRIARHMAVRRSTDAGEPAMFTILFGIGLVLITYVIHLTIVGMVVHSLLFDCLYLAGLLSGAYWAAFQQHPRRY
ncbi:MAG: glycerol-3-phosphate O-acyltransferase / dihydroxyacetone phosphate acyltransferase [Gemmatimonadaceae bacterium]|jgi:1-acyl-sn-glycerol-3-phosphate acyltransferase|nr:glycerol-3-phosphate O-acyltransferase / dihydroxyacetone phosphate acyltransferase [Gemmatimonadaceae bacterium]